MKSYLVGGAVRDILMGREPKDRDYVVVGATPKDMIDAGFEQVGASFPVFLHPRTGEEYALARKERKVGPGYHGFETVHDTSVTIQEDLSRRDLTINSVAIDYETENYIDPFGGRRDLQDKVLRHTSEAFAEDPLRVVRLARFYARYHALGFNVHPETAELCRQMVEAGELNELPDERFWLELQKAFDDEQPARFFEFLFSIGALNHVEFFRQLLDGVHIGSIIKVMELASVCKKRCPPNLVVDLFAALVVPSHTINFLPTARSINLFNAWNLVEGLSGEVLTAEKVVSLLNKIRAWGEGTTATDLALALAIAEEAFRVPKCLTSYQFIDSLNTGRTVTSERFQHLKGREIGEALTAERVRRVKGVL